MKSEILQSQIDRLNPGQREAVETIEGPVLVVAGPGTGKTQVLALRIANIIDKTDVRPSNILCLTFTESGVVAMRQRLLRMIGTDAYYVRIHTFHSFCNEIIQSFPEKFAFARELIQLDDLNRLKIIREILEKLTVDVDNEGASSTTRLQLVPFHDKFFYQNAILSSIQTLKREGITAERLEKISKENLEHLENNPSINKRTGKPTGEWTTNFKSEQRNLELAQIYQMYNDTLLDRGYYDYEDMILFVIKKFKEDDELLAYYQERYLYILVDEYQDTNGAQNEILKLLGSFDASPNMFAVGDDDQAIYRFQGANVANLLFFEKQFENVKTIPITINYRSSQLILDLSNSLVKNNKARLVNFLPDLKKELKAGLAIPKHNAEVFEFSSNDIENKFIVDKIKELNRNGLAYSDIAIFYRKHADAEDIAEAMLDADIPIQLAAGRNSLDEQIVQQFLNLIKVIQYTDKNRDFLLFQVLFYDFLGFDRLDVFKVTRFAHDKRTSIFDLISTDELLTEAHIQDKEKFIEFAQNIAKWKGDSANLSLIQFIQQVAIKSNYISYIFKEPANIENINSINSFYSYIRELNRQNKKITVEEFLHDIKLLEENGLSIEEKELDINRKGVHLMTAHKAKGLEFKYVFIIKFYDGNWGGRTKRDIIKLPREVFDLNNSNNDGATARLQNQTLEIDEIEDERRLLFVAITRAKEKLFLTYSKTYPSGNSTKEVSPSQFLTELRSDLIEHGDSSSYEQVAEEDFKRKILNHKIISPYTVNEEDYLRYIIKNYKLNVTGLNLYLECPLKFKFHALLKVPEEKTKSLALGTSVHYALEHFYRELKKGNEKDLGFLLEMFKKGIGRQLVGPEDYNAILNEGTKILTDYYNNYKDTFINPAEIEYTFHERELILELPGMEPVQLSGKMDKIEWINQAQNTVRIVDYKTCAPMSQNEVKGLTKNSNGDIFRQLVFYKLLADCDNFFRPNLSASKYQIEEVEVDFIKPNNNGYFKREIFSVTDENLDNLKKTVAEVMAKIRNLEFRNPDDLCRECEYCKMIEDN